MRQTRLIILIVAVALVVAGICIGVAVADRGASPHGGMMGLGTADVSMSSYYDSVMAKYQDGSMMEGDSPVTYSWMMGGRRAPGWMAGGGLPTGMMGQNTGAGEAVGRLFADAPGTRLTARQAIRLGDQVPEGATVNRSDNRLAFRGAADHFVVLAGYPRGRGLAFRSAGMMDPTITVRSGASITIELVNTASDSALGLTVTAHGASSSETPMMTASSAFQGSSLWFLGDATSVGMHVGVLTFTASRAGAYQYICPVPGDARDGMVGSFVVAG
jgi:hypothetical protein